MAHGARSGARSAGVGSARSACLVGPAGVGKTWLAEQLLHRAGVVREPGLEAPLLHADAESREAGATASPGWAWLPVAEGVLHLADTPGALDHAYPAALARWGTDMDVVVVDARGPTAGAAAWLKAVARGSRPLVVALTRWDVGTRLGEADLEAHVAAVAELAVRPAVAPWRPEGAGLADRLGGPAGPDRNRAVEAVASADDGAAEAWLDAGDLDRDAAAAALVRAVRAGRLVAVVPVSGRDGRGADVLLDLLGRAAPADASTAGEAPVVEVVGAHLDPEGAPVTVLRVRSGTLRPNATLVTADGTRVRLHKLYRIRGPRRSLADEAGPGDVVASWEPLDVVPGETLGAEGRPPPVAPPPSAWRRLVGPAGRGAATDAAVASLLRLDPSIRATRRAPGTWDVAGATSAALDGLVARLARRFGLVVAVGPQPLDDRERPSRCVVGVEGKGRTASGEPASEIAVDLGPSEDGDAVFVEVDVDEEDLPARLHDAVREGVGAALAAGPLGHPVDGVHVRVVRAWYDILDAEPVHVVAAARAAVEAALREAVTQVFEPWSDVLCLVPEPHLGDALSEIGARRGRTEGLDVDGDEVAVRSRVPDREVEGLASRLLAVTRGASRCYVRASHHEPLAAGVRAARPGAPADRASPEPR